MAKSSIAGSKKTTTESKYDQTKIDEARKLVEAVTFRPLSKEKTEKSRTLAFATVEFTNGLIVRDVRVVEGSKGNFVSMPNKTVPKREGKEDSGFLDLVFFKTAEQKFGVSNEILDCWAKEAPAGN